VAAKIFFNSNRKIGVNYDLVSYSIFGTKEPDRHLGMWIGLNSQLITPPDSLRFWVEEYVG
jgi:hypothetical protein